METGRRQTLEIHKCFILVYPFHPKIVPSHDPAHNKSNGAVEGNHDRTAKEFLYEEYVSKGRQRVGR